MFLLLTVVVAVVLSAMFFARRDADKLSLLHRSNDLIEAQPDTALQLLVSVDTLSGSSSTRALHALLLTQARVKCDVPIANDSLISTAMDHYTDHGPDSLLMRAAFYKAYVDWQLKDYGRAIIPASQAHDIAVQSNNDYWRAKTAELLGFISDKSYLREEAIVYYGEAAKFYKKAGNELNYLFSLCDQAGAYMQANNIKNAYELLDSLDVLSMAQQDSREIELYIITARLFLDVQAEDYDAAVKTLKRAEQLGVMDNGIVSAVVTQVSASQGEEVDEQHFSNRLRLPDIDTEEKISIWEMLYFYHKRSGNWEKALDCSDSLVAIQNSIVRDVIKQSVVKASRDEYASRAKTEHIRAEQIKQRFIIFISAASLFIIMGSYIVFLLIRSKRQELRQKIQEIYALTSAMEIKILENESLKQSVTEKEKSLAYIDKDKSNQIAHLHEALIKEGENAKALRQELDRVNYSMSEKENDTNDKIEASSHEVQIESVKLFRKQWDIINHICRDYLEEGKIVDAKRCVASLQREIVSFSSKKNISELERSVNSHMDNVMDKLRYQCSWLNESDVNFILFTYAGFTSSAVSLFVGIKNKYFYTKRARLIERISKSGCEDAELFISMLYPPKR